MTVAVRFDNVSKQYRLGEIGTGTLSHDLHRAWARLRGKPDPFAEVGTHSDCTLVENDIQKGKAAPPAGGANRYLWALRHVNFEVGKGDVLGIIGHNGAGKSTLLKLLSRVTGPTTGKIKARGRIASLLEVGTGFHPELSGRDNIFLNGAILGMRRTETATRLDEIVEFSGCGKFIDTPVKRYSSGMKVRLGFAVAAHLNCEILVVDEVLAVGDTEFQKACMEKMREISHTAHRTIFFVSHNLLSIKRLCNKGLLLENGSVASFGATSDVINLYQSRFDPLSTTTSLSELPRSGTGKVKFQRIEIVSATGIPHVAIKSGDKVIFRLTIDGDLAGRTHAIASIALKDELDSYVWLVRSSFDDAELDINHSTTIECQVEELALAPGTYKAVLFLSERDTEILDRIDNAFIFTVQPGRFFANGSPGLPSHCKTLTRASWRSY